ncbi:hypothetical protein [Neotabrizicola shimadae]|uniref:Uncharacterized protein n=1 Tax=Neotabrizicola shimadae TaxID=2807096 RepID=A0A8G0ZU84_9RHOB|nr:hypothetical protein [Neotabrizicola shimadae]QYZ68184.1 hypothetical protein JO391_10265 [Neotabrizicola shimadae]
MWTRLTLCLALLPLPVQAESPIAEVICAPRAQMVARLSRLYGPQPAASGLRDTDTVVEVWASPRGDWTLVQSNANGQACILAMGEAWDAAAPQLPG